MNEWSPGGNYSRPGTPNHAGKSHRCQWDESEKNTKPLIVNIRAVSEGKTRSFHQHSIEDISKSSVSINSKHKRSENGGSDPRFKRVISNGLQNDACVGTEGRSSNKSHHPTPLREKEGTKSKQSPWTASGESKTNQPWGDAADVKEIKVSHTNERNDEHPDAETLFEKTPSNFDQTQDHFKAVDKLAFNHDILVQALSKDSVSNCTINTSLTSENLLDDFSKDLTMYQSTNRVKKVQHWIQDQKPKTEKKQSVVTVIGQTQGDDMLCSALREIDKRRKLVKELDKYAICKKIVDTDTGKEISELAENISSSKGRASENVSCGNLPESRKMSSSRNGSGDTIEKHFEKKGKFKAFFSHVQYQWIIYAIFMLSTILCWMTFCKWPTNFYIPLDLFNKKPKSMTWYEKICMWLWELFRPSGNYKRSSPWNSY